MDVRSFIQRRGHINLMALRSAYVYLRAVQLEKRFIEYGDVCQGLLMGADLTNSEVVAHNALIYESAVVSIPFPDGFRRWQFQFDYNGEVSFLQCIFRCLQVITYGKFYPSVETFKRDCERHSLPPRALTPIMEPNSPKMRREPRVITPVRNSVSSYSPALKSDLSPVPLQANVPKDCFELSDQGIRFLAEIRRGGMDILFPQIKHDQVLCIIFAIFILVKSTAHKELIDMVMAVKESGLISNLEGVSKTKVRGVIALLKLASIVETQGGSNDKIPVTLTLSSSTDSIETMREQHDEFLSTYGCNNSQLWLEEVYWGKVIWGTAFSKRVEKIKEVQTFLPKLLNLSVLRQTIVTAKGCIEDIFVTREQALESDVQYQSFSFKFQPSEDDNDHSENDGTTAAASICSPSSVMSKSKAASYLSVSKSTTSQDMDSAGTSVDEWSIDSTPPVSSLSRVEYRSPLLKVVPEPQMSSAVGRSNPSNFNSISLNNYVGMPMSARDFTSGPLHSTPHSSNSYPPHFMRDQHLMGSFAMGRDVASPIGLGPSTFSSHPQGSDLLGQGREHLYRRHSLDSPTGLFSESFFQSPIPQAMEMPVDNWQYNIDHRSPFRRGRENKEDDFGQQVQQQQHEMQQTLTIGRRKTLPNPPDAVEIACNEHYQQQPSDDFYYARRIAETHSFSPLPSPYPSHNQQSFYQHLNVQRPHEPFHRDNFPHINTEPLYSQEEESNERVQQHQRLRDSRHSISHSHSNLSQMRGDKVYTHPIVRTERINTIALTRVEQTPPLPPPLSYLSALRDSAISVPDITASPNG